MKLRAKDAIANTFVDLIRTSSFEKVTVQDLTAATGVSRQSFYNNFLDKQEVAEYVYLREFSNGWEEFSDWNAYIEKTAAFYESYGDFLLPVYRATNYLAWLEDYQRAAIRDRIRHTCELQELDPEVDYALQLYVSGAFRLLQRRIDAHERPDFVGQLRRDAQYMPDALKPFLLATP